jgi:hypothetical protein
VDAYASRASQICASQANLWSCDVCRSWGSEVPWNSLIYIFKLLYDYLSIILFTFNLHFILVDLGVISGWKNVENWDLTLLTRS